MPLFPTRLLVIASLCAAISFGGCSSSPSGTTVRLDVTYDDAWALTRFSLSADDRSDTTAVARTVTVVLPDDMAGREITIDLWALRGDTRFAHGDALVTPKRGAQVRASITLTRVPCGAWCTPGATSCQGDATVICEQRDDDGCFEWSEPTECPTAAPFCSLGVCDDTCIDECELGDARCAGPAGVQTCGNADSDTCNEWLAVSPCGDGDTCSNGACAATCQSECEAGASQCLGAGTITCADRDDDGCLEWGPIVPCDGGESCSDGVCAAGCTDECTVSSCDALNFTACGQYDLDTCKDRSPGVSCVPSDPCLEGACAAATGCSTAPKICDAPPEAECITADTLRVYQAQGSCEADGSCDYTFDDRTCANCPSCDPCEGVTCNTPPAPAACYVAAGTCDDTGVCEYAYNDSATCNDGNACTLSDSCDTGVCSGTPKTCNTPPAATCVNATTLRTYNATGTCTSGTGNCTYGHTDATCANGCAAGACTQPAWIAVGVGGRSVFAEEGHSCGLRGNGTIACWGNQDPDPTGTFVALSVGGMHACGVRTNGSLACWGSNGWGQSAAPAGSFTAVSAGGLHSCGVRADASAVCWGRNGDGQASAPPDAFIAISANGYHSCGLRTDNTIVCWGDDLYNQASPPTGSFVSVSAGEQHTCAIRESGTITCWGRDNQGQASPPSGTFTSVSAGADYSCGVRTNGTVTCWGLDVQGEASPPSGTFTAVSARYSHTCGLRTNGTIACWGANGAGQSTPPP